MTEVTFKAGKRFTAKDIVHKLEKAGLAQRPVANLESEMAVCFVSVNHLIRAASNSRETQNARLGSVKIQLTSDRGIITVVPTHIHTKGNCTFRGKELEPLIRNEIDRLPGNPAKPNLITVLKEGNQRVGLCHQISPLSSSAHLSLTSKSVLNPAGEVKIESVILDLVAIDIRSGLQLRINYQQNDCGSPKGNIFISKRGKAARFLHLQQEALEGQAPGSSYIGNTTDGRDLVNSQKYNDPAFSPSSAIRKMIDLFRKPERDMPAAEIIKKLGIPIVII